MSLSTEIKQLDRKWKTPNLWPKRLLMLKINNIRGWKGEEISFNFPIVAITGENGSGKSTILQAAATVYRPTRSSSKKSYFAATFFPDTPWENFADATISYSVHQGTSIKSDILHKTAVRWRKYENRPDGDVTYIDLSRIVPVAVRKGYAKLAKAIHTESSATPFSDDKIQKLSNILDREYQSAKIAYTNIDKRRPVPVVNNDDKPYSGFHQGAGETSIIEFLQYDFPKNSLLLIDEIETSLHPRAQRRLIRYLAELCRLNEMQVILTTHSPYILDELPLEARLYIIKTAPNRQVIAGVSPDFAMTQMDDELHPECDVYFEDREAGEIIKEVLIKKEKDLVKRCAFIPYGAASTGRALGIMKSENRFPRPTCVFIDGDQIPTPKGCISLTGETSPEEGVFNGLKDVEFKGVAVRLGRSHSEVVDACRAAMRLSDHHDWIQSIADKLVLGGEQLWQALASEWVNQCLSDTDADRIHKAIVDALDKS